MQSQIQRARAVRLLKCVIYLHGEFHQYTIPQKKTTPRTNIVGDKPLLLRTFLECFLSSSSGCISFLFSLFSASSKPRHQAKKTQKKKVTSCCNGLQVKESTAASSSSPLSKYLLYRRIRKGCRVRLVCVHIAGSLLNSKSMKGQRRGAGGVEKCFSFLFGGRHKYYPNIGTYTYTRDVVGTSRTSK